MTERTTVDGAVSVRQDCKERVAYDLMKYVSGYEAMDKDAPRRYWLELFRDCFSAVSGRKLFDDLDERPRRQ